MGDTQKTAPPHPPRPRPETFQPPLRPSLGSGLSTDLSNATYFIPGRSTGFVHPDVRRSVRLT